MAAAFDEEDLAIPLSSDRDQRERRSPQNPSAMAIPPSKPSGKPEDPLQSPSTTRDMQRLDQYQTIRVLGEGSFGKVKLAIHPAKWTPGGLEDYLAAQAALPGYGRSRGARDSISTIAATPPHHQTV